MFAIFIFHWSYLFILAGGLVAFWAQNRVMSTFRTWLQKPAQCGLTGAHAARKVLDARGLQDVAIERVAGTLSDHYDPRSRVLRLSGDVHDKTSVSSIAVACHEAGHAVQHQENYGPLVLRGTLVPAASFGSNLGLILFFAGLFIAQWSALTYVGIAFFSLAAVFALVTLPVEFDASRRALVMLNDNGLISREEDDGMREVLDAAAWTYIAGALMAVLQVIQLLLIAGDRRD